MMMQDTKLMANELMRKAVNYTINQCAYSGGYPFSKMPEMEIRKARPLGDSHGLAYFHLRR